METIVWVKNNWADVLTIITYTVTIASIVVKFTANTIDDNIVMRFLKVLSLAPKQMK